MIFNRKKKQRLDDSLSKLSPTYAYKLDKKRKRRKEMFKTTIKITILCIIPIVLICSIIGLSWSTTNSHLVLQVISTVVILISLIGGIIYSSSILE